MFNFYGDEVVICYFLTDLSVCCPLTDLWAGSNCYSEMFIASLTALRHCTWARMWPLCAIETRYVKRCTSITFMGATATITEYKRRNILLTESSIEVRTVLLLIVTEVAVSYNVWWWAVVALRTRFLKLILGWRPLLTTFRCEWARFNRLI